MYILSDRPKIKIIDATTVKALIMRSMGEFFAPVSWSIFLR